MKKVFNVQWWQTSSSFNPQEREMVAEFEDSRVFAIETKGERLLIKQIAGVRTSFMGMLTFHAQNEIRYYLSLYQDSGFEGREADLDHRYSRFFTSPTRLEPTTGRSYSYRTLFDVRKPIEFHYSSNTPESYVSAVKAGIEYWNRAFDNPIVKALPAPEGVTSPDPDYNIVQWVPWDNAGFAYADIIADPRTGETLHGQVYMTSVFAVASISSARSLLRTLKATNANQPKLQGVGVDFLKSATLCQLDMNQYRQHFIAGLESILEDPSVSDDAILEFSKSYVAEVIAHEIGHVLGLRHNFAGSLASNMTPDAKKNWLKKFLQDPSSTTTEGLLTSNSLMEYQVLIDGIITGQKIMNSSEILPHDRAAIRHGYFGETTVEDEKMFFCTDEQMGQWLDCMVFDSGKEILITSTFELHQYANNIPFNLIERFIAEKTAEPASERRSPEAVNLDVDAYAASLTGYLSQIAPWLNAKSRSLVVERPYEFIGDLNSDQIDQDYWTYINSQSQKLGGVGTMLFSFLPENLWLKAKSHVDTTVASEIPITNAPVSAKAWKEKFAKALDSDLYAEFIGVDGNRHSFTSQERQTMKDMAASFFELLEERVLNYYFLTLSSMNLDYPTTSDEWMNDEDILYQIESAAGALATEILTAVPAQRSEATFINGKVRDSYRLIKDFSYKFETRQAAAALLANSNFGSYPYWAKTQKSAAKTNLESYVKKALDEDASTEFNAIDPTTFSRSIHHWFDKQRTLHGMVAL